MNDNINVVRQLYSNPELIDILDKIAFRCLKYKHIFTKSNFLNKFKLRAKIVLVINPVNY